MWTLKWPVLGMCGTEMYNIFVHILARYHISRKSEISQNLPPKLVSGVSSLFCSAVNNNT